MRITDVRFLFAYDRWATKRILVPRVGVDEATWSAEAVVDERGLGGILVHQLGAHQRWRHGLSGMPRAPRGPNGTRSRRSRPCAGCGRTSAKPWRPGSTASRTAGLARDRGRRPVLAMLPTWPTTGPSTAPRRRRS